MQGERVPGVRCLCSQSSARAVTCPAHSSGLHRAVISVGMGQPKAAAAAGLGRGGGHNVHNCPGGVPKKRASRLQLCGTGAILWGSSLPQNMQTEGCNIDMGQPRKLSPPTHRSPPRHPKAAPLSSPHSPRVGTALPRSQPRPALAAPPPGLLHPPRSRPERGCRVQQQRCQWGGAQHPPAPPRQELHSLWPFCDQTPGSGEITAGTGTGRPHSCPWLCPGHAAWGGGGGVLEVLP